MSGCVLTRSGDTWTRPKATELPIRQRRTIRRVLPLPRALGSGGLWFSGPAINTNIVVRHGTTRFTMGPFQSPATSLHITVTPRRVEYSLSHSHRHTGKFPTRRLRGDSPSSFIAAANDLTLVPVGEA
ncbi:hypothetical protein BaRGS_00009338 [Batillaria attramentaria]|uniref:Uncharacterized protein n=1 Tax=Batillaria attramentaria TaxID=370345 RepID=A0ABD0LJM0_9CAEN